MKASHSYRQSGKMLTHSVASAISLASNPLCQNYCSGVVLCCQIMSTALSRVPSDGTVDRRGRLERGRHGRCWRCWRCWPGLPARLGAPTPWGPSWRARTPTPPQTTLWRASWSAASMSPGWASLPRRAHTHNPIEQHHQQCDDNNRIIQTIVLSLHTHFILCCRIHALRGISQKSGSHAPCQCMPPSLSSCQSPRSLCHGRRAERP